MYVCVCVCVCVCVTSLQRCGGDPCCSSILVCSVKPTVQLIMYKERIQNGICRPIFDRRTGAGADPSLRRTGTKCSLSLRGVWDKYTCYCYCYWKTKCQIFTFQVRRRRPITPRPAVDASSDVYAPTGMTSVGNNKRLFGRRQTRPTGCTTGVRRHQNTTRVSAII